MSTTRTLATSVALISLGALATACGGDAGTPSADPTTTKPSPLVALGAAVPSGTATSPDLLQCLAQSGLQAWGADARTTGTPADYVSAERSSYTTAGNLGGLWVFADAATAERYAEYAFQADLIDDLEPAEATYEVHGNVLVTAERPLVEPALLACLPDAATPTVVAAPAPGTATFGSLMTCARAAGLGAKGGFNEPGDTEFGTVGTLSIRKPNLDSVAYLYLFADAATALAREADTTEWETPGTWLRAGNVIAVFDGALTQPGKAQAAVLACLPTEATAPAALAGGAEEFVVTDGTTPEELLACIEAIGYRPSPPYAEEPYGVDAPVLELDVYGMLGSLSGELDQAAYLYLFTGSELAAANAEWLIDEDADPAGNQYGVHGNVVRAFNTPLAATPNQEEQAVLDCLPA